MKVFGGMRRDGTSGSGFLAGFAAVRAFDVPMILPVGLNGNWNLSRVNSQSRRKTSWLRGQLERGLEMFVVFDCASVCLRLPMKLLLTTLKYRN